MASLNFGTAYLVNVATTPAGKESNVHDFAFTALGNGDGVTIDDGNVGAFFNGNDVAVISAVIGGQTYYGWISRPIKDGGVVKGFYYWTDTDFDSLAEATADGNTDGDANESDNLGLILVVDQAWFDALGWENQALNLKQVNSSSDPVDDDLNDLVMTPPTVVITEDTDNNGVITSGELSGAVNVAVTLPATAVAGDVLTVTDGTTPQTFTLNAAQILAGQVLTTFAAPAEGGTITVTAYVDHLNIQSGSGSDSALLDTTGPGAPTVVITEDANNDGVISGSEFTAPVNVTVTLPAGALAGDVLTVTDGITPQTFTLSAAQILAGQVLTSFAAPAEGGTITVTAYVTDQVGNQGASGNDSAVRDTAGPGAPSVVITEDANNDGVISGSEFTAPVNVTVTLPGGALAGDVLTVTDGITPQTFTLSAAQILAGQVLTSFAAPAEGGTITVTAHVTDQVGNQGASGNDSAVRDTAGPGAPTVVISEDANDDEVISGSELVGNVDVTVTLPAGAVAGDVLTVTDGTTPQTFTLSAAQILAGQVLTTFAAPAEGGTITVTAYVTDQVGNQGASGNDFAVRDTTGPGAPTVLIAEDVNNDGVISAGELSGNVDVTVNLPAGALAGDVLTVTDGITPQTFTLSAAQILAGQVLTSFAAPAQDATITVTAYVTDQVGNQGASGTDSAVRDSAGPGAPTVLIVEDSNNDGVISGSELSGNIDVTVTLPAGALAGDVLSVTDGTTSQTFTLSAAQILAGQVLTAFAAPAEGGTITVTAYVTDQAGNQGVSGNDSALLDTTGPGAPTVLIAEDSNNDGVISGSELIGNVDVTVTLPAGALAGDVLTVTDGSTPQTFTLSAAQILAGQVLTTFAAPAEGGTITITAYVTDQVGNQGASGNDSALRDTAAPGAPTVVIDEDANNDGVIDGSELSGDVDVTVTLPAGALAGDVLTVTDGITPQTFTLSAAQILAGQVLTSFTAPVQGATITVTAFVTDQVGNQSASGNDSALRDGDGPGAPTVVIAEDTNNDGVISGSELSGDVDVIVALPAGALAGDVLTVTDGTTPQTFTLSAAQILAGQVLTTFAAPSEGGTIAVTAFVTDQVGNQGASGNDSAVRDSAGPGAPTVVITEDTNNNGVISGSELSGNVDVTVTLPAGAVAGDVLTVTDGTTPQTFTLSAAQVLAGQVLTAFAAPAEGGTITVTAFVTDQVGNQGASGNDSAVRDTAGPGAPTVVITEDTNNSGVISASELSGNVDVTVSLPAGAVAGDVLTVSNGTTPQTFTLTAAQILAGQVLTSFVPPPEGGTITVTAFVTDQAGNQGATGSDSALRDVVAPLGAPTVVIAEDANNDGVISGSELSGNVDVTVRLPAGALAGHVLTVSDGIAPQTFTLTAAQIAAGEVLTTFVAPAEGGTITVTAHVTNQFGNPGASGSDSAIRDTLANSAPTVVITEDINNDGVISGSELSGNVDVTVSLPGDAVAGDVLTVTDGTTPQTFTLSAAQILAGQVLTSFAAPVQGATITVTAFVTDQVGNEGAGGSDSAVRDTAGPGAPTVVIIEDANNDGVISGSELSGNVDVRVSLPAGAVAGNVLTVTNGTTTQTFTLSVAQILAGQVLTSFAPPAQGAAITVTAHVTDQVGNQGATGSDSAVRDTTGSEAPTVVITEDANNDGVISGSELNGNVDVTVGLPAGALAGDVLTVTDGVTPQTFTLSAAQILAGQVLTSFAAPVQGATITVTAFVTDQVGNPGASGSDSAVRDTAGPGAPFVVIAEDANNDGVISTSELIGTIEVTVNLPVEAVAGDVLTITDGQSTQTVSLTVEHIAAGVSIASFAAPSPGGSITVTAFVTDQFGNVGTSGGDFAVLALGGGGAVIPPLPPVVADPVYSVLLANGDRFYTTDATEAAKMAEGTNNVFEGARFDSLAADQGGVHINAWYQPFTTDWYFSADGVFPPYACYELQPEMIGFLAARAGQGAGAAYHLYLNDLGATQLVTQAEAGQLGLLSQGYLDYGAQFRTTADSAFVFDAEGYLIANHADAGVRALVATLATTHTSTKDAGFIELVEQDYLAKVQITGVAHGDAASAEDLNAIFGTAFSGV